MIAFNADGMERGSFERSGQAIVETPYIPLAICWERFDFDATTSRSNRTRP